MKSFVVVFAVLLSFSSSSLFGQKQKIDLDKLNFQKEYIWLPTSNELKDFNSYSIAFDAKQETLNKFDLNPKVLEEYFQLEGYSYLKDNSGDFIYSIQMGEQVVLSENILEVEKEVKTSEGTKLVTKYIAEIKLSVPTVIQLINNETGEPIYASVFSTEDDPTVYTDSESSSEAEAQKRINLKISGLNSMVRNVYIDRLKTEVRKVKDLYTYRKETTKLTLWEINLKKSPQLEQFQKEIDKVAYTLETASYREPIYPAQIKLQPVLDKWENEAGKLGSSDKYEKKLKFAYLYNLATAQLWLELYDDVFKTCDELIKHGYKTYEATSIKNIANTFIKKNEDTGHNGVHFYRSGFYDEYDFKYEKQALEKKKSKWNLVATSKEEMQKLKNFGNGLKEDYKEMKEEFTLGQEVGKSNAYYSTASFEIDGKAYEFKKGGLKVGNGSANSYSSEDYYRLAVYAKSGIVSEKNSFVGFRINLYKKDDAKIGVTDVVSLLSKYNGQTLQDISTRGSLDSVPFKKNGVLSPPKNISWSDYDKELSIDVEFSFRANSRDGSYAYKTMNGDAVKLELVEKTPIQAVGNGGSKSDAYMAKFRIEEVVLTRFWYGHYLPMYTNKRITVKNLEFYILIM